MLKEHFNHEQIEIIRKQNEELLGEFQTFLEEKGLKQQSIEKHVYNIAYFLNEFLLYRDKRPEEVVLEMDDFLGRWFIKKTPWVTMSAILSMISSIKKLYVLLYEKENITKKELQLLYSRIKRSQQNWINRLKSTNY